MRTLSITFSLILNSSCFISYWIIFQIKHTLLHFIQYRINDYFYSIPKLSANGFFNDECVIYDFTVIIVTYEIYELNFIQ